MGTRGIRVIKFRGRYWVFWNQYDSYLEGLGDSLVQSIPSDPDEYQKWLQSQRAVFAKWDHLLQQFLSITQDQLQSIKYDKTRFDFLEEAFDERMHMMPNYNPRWSMWDIEYTYIINLDLEVFTIDHSAHFRLDKIPKDEWMRTLDTDNIAYASDRCSRLFVHPRLAPSESLADLVVKSKAFTPEDKTYWNALPKRKVWPIIDDDLVISTSVKIRLKLFDVFAKAHFQALDADMLSWNVNDLPFREVVFFILCLAAGGAHIALVDERRIQTSFTSGPSYSAILPDDSSKEKNELVSALGVGFHMEDQPAGSAPASSKYWFEGVLICLVREPSLRRAQGDAIRYGREVCKRLSFNAILISIRKVVLLRAFPDGSVDYSTTFPLFNGILSGLSARDRYNPDWLDMMCDAKLARRAKRAADEKAYEERKAARERAAAAKKATEEEVPLDKVNDASPKEEHDNGKTMDEAVVPELIVSGDCTTAIKEIDLGENQTTNNDMEKSHNNTNHHVETEEVDGLKIEVQAGKADANTDTHATEEPQASTEAMKTDEESKDHADRGNCAVSNQEHEGEDDVGQETKDGGITKKNEEEKERTGKDAEEEAKKEEGKQEKKDEAEEDSDDWTTNDTFLALVQMFDATVRERLKPTDTTIQKLPIEILENIMGFISDTKTHNACAEVSRTFRELCNKRSFIMDGVIVEDIPQSERADTSCNIPQSNYRAVELKSGRQIHFEIKDRKEWDRDSRFRLVIGSEENRKLFCPDCPLVMKGLDTETPSTSDPGPPPTHPITSTNSQPDSEEQEETAWSKTFQQEKITAESSTEDLCRFWELFLKNRFPEEAGRTMDILRAPRIKDWFVPPNTRTFMISTSAYSHEVYQHMLYMRIKRESRYWTTELWDSIIEETKQALDSIDDNHQLTNEGIVQKVGMGNPLVMLVVGREVRFFEWQEAATANEDTSGSLEPLLPGTYSIANVEQRESIELVLRLVMAKLGAAKWKKEHLISPGVARLLVDKGHKLPPGQIGYAD